MGCMESHIVVEVPTPRTPLEMYRLDDATIEQLLHEIQQHTTDFARWRYEVERVTAIGAVPEAVVTDAKAEVDLLAAQYYEHIHLRPKQDANGNAVVVVAGPKLSWESVQVRAQAAIYVLRENVAPIHRSVIKVHLQPHIINDRLPPSSAFTVKQIKAIVDLFRSVDKHHIGVVNEKLLSEWVFANLESAAESIFFHAFLGVRSTSRAHQWCVDEFVLAVHDWCTMVDDELMFFLFHTMSNGTCDNGDPGLDPVKLQGDATLSAPKGQRRASNIAFMKQLQTTAAEMDTTVIPFAAFRDICARSPQVLYPIHHMQSILRDKTLGRGFWADRTRMLQTLRLGSDNHVANKYEMPSAEVPFAMVDVRILSAPEGTVHPGAPATRRSLIAQAEANGAKRGSITTAEGARRSLAGKAEPRRSVAGQGDSKAEPRRSVAGKQTAPEPTTSTSTPVDAFDELDRHEAAVVFPSRRASGGNTIAPNTRTHIRAVFAVSPIAAHIKRNSAVRVQKLPGASKIPRRASAGV